MGKFNNRYTAREVYIQVLTELDKVEAPALYLEDYVYYYNKAISEYLKARYELFETNQQLSDDLRFWKRSYESTCLVIPIEDIGVITPTPSEEPVRYYYRHLVGCTLDVELLRPIMGCEQSVGTTKQYKVTRMSSSIKVGILNNDYLKAEFYRPYFEIIDDTININIGDINTKSIKFSNIVVEYLKQPDYVDLTADQVSDNTDESQELEFSKDVSDEITKGVLKLILERDLNPRLQSNVGVNKTISDASTGMVGR